MKDNTKILIVILLVVVFLCLGIFIAYSIIPKEDKDINVNIDLGKLKLAIENAGEYREIASYDINTENIESIFGISPESVEEVIGKAPLIDIKSSMYAVVKAKSGMQDTVKQKFEEYGNKKETEWENYLAEQYELVKSRKIDVVGDYVYIVISSSLDDVVSLIK